MHNTVRFLTVFFIIFIMAGHAALAEISADHSAGAVIVGPAADTCNAGIEGSIRYNQAGKFLEYCNGTAWAMLGNTLATRPDVLITNVQDGQSLIYNAGLSKWSNNACDDIPAAFSFTDLTQQALSTVVSSNILQITGISCSADAFLTGEGIPEFRICSDATCSSVVANWTRTRTPVVTGQYIQLRMNTSSVPGITYTATLNVGSSSDAWSVTTVPPKRVFVSSATYNGNLGGLSGADTKCQTLADAVPLGGTYKAWLSDSTTSAASRLTQSTLYYILVNGTRIANNWADLTSGDIDAPINVTETGAAPGSTPVWTNTNTNGAITSISTSLNCTNWTSSSSGVNGYQGSTAWADYDWTNNTWNPCNQLKRLYCFEQ